MSDRFKMVKVQPEAYKAMAALDTYNKISEIDNLHREMIKIRASQINGCAYCLNIHTKDAREYGETEQRIYLMSAWREAGDMFSEDEQLILEMTEQITLIQEKGLSDDVYSKAVVFFGEERTAQIIMAIITINAWNRISISLHMHP